MADFILSAFADEASVGIDGQVKALKRNGIKHIELRNIDGKCIIDLSVGEQEEIRGLLEENEIGVSSIASPIGKIGLNEDFEEHFERFKKAVSSALIFSTKRIRMFSFFMPQGEDISEHEAQVVSRLKRMCNYAYENGVYCCHENEKDIYGDIAKRAVSLHELVGEKMKGIFDPANYVQCKERPGEIFDRLYPYLEYLHIKDALLSDGAVVPAGEGDGDIADVVKRFHQKGDGLFLTVEPHLTIFDGFSNLQADKLVHHKSYKTADEAFDEAVRAIKIILDREGFSYE